MHEPIMAVVGICSIILMTKVKLIKISINIKDDNQHK
jgi:hypothetical protein